MAFGVGGVLELLEHDRSGNLREQRLGPGDGPLHAFGPGGEDHLCAVSRHEPLPLDAHRLGHGEDQLIAFQCADERQSDTRIAARGLDDHGSGTDCAAGFGLLDHRQGDAVLHASGGVEQFDFGDDPGHGAGLPAQARQFDQRCVADEVQC